MTATVRTIEPSQITTREEIHWTKSYPDYPATLWTLQYRFRGPSSSATGFNVTATADGDDYDIVVPSSTTDDMTVAGIYKWQAWLTEIADSTNKKLIGEGRTRVVIGYDPDDLTIDTRTDNEIALDTVNAALLAFATSNILEVEVTTPAGSRRVKRSDNAQLLVLQKHYATLVANERARERSRQGHPIMQSVKVRMKDA